MSADLSVRLREAIGTGEILGIVYHGGSRPGAFRQIAPIRMEGDQVRARCYTSKAVKAFVIAKIELREAATAAAGDDLWQSAPVFGFASIADAAAHFQPQLEALGWHVEFGPFEEGEALRIFARLKNGKPRRTAAVSFAYEAMTHDVGIDRAGQLVRCNERPRVRPWTVRAHGKASSWGRVEGAITAFMLAAGLSTSATQATPGAA